MSRQLVVLALPTAYRTFEQQPPNIRPMVRPQLTTAGKAPCMAMPVKAMALDTVILALGCSARPWRASLASISLVPGGTPLSSAVNCVGPRRRAVVMSLRVPTVMLGMLDLRVGRAMVAYHAARIDGCTGKIGRGRGFGRQSWSGVGGGSDGGKKNSRRRDTVTV
jgi:uncharacterized membrane protein YgcG